MLYSDSDEFDFISGGSIFPDILDSDSHDSDFDSVMLGLDPYGIPLVL